MLLASGQLSGGRWHGDRYGLARRTHARGAGVALSRACTRRCICNFWQCPNRNDVCLVDGAARFARFRTNMSIELLPGSVLGVGAVGRGHSDVLNVGTIMRVWRGILSVHSRAQRRTPGRGSLSLSERAHQRARPDAWTADGRNVFLRRATVASALLYGQQRGACVHRGDPTVKAHLQNLHLWRSVGGRGVFHQGNVSLP